MRIPIQPIRFKLVPAVLAGWLALTGSAAADEAIILKTAVDRF